MILQTMDQRFHSTVYVAVLSEPMNGPLALTGHMVQNSPYWMVKKSGILHWDIENKGKSSLTGWNSFVFDSTTDIRLPSCMADFVPCDQLVRKAHFQLSVSPGEDTVDRDRKA